MKIPLARRAACAILGLIALSSLGHAAPGASFYISPTGSDSNAGTLAAPFLTLEKAQSAIRALKTASGLPAGGIAVYLRGGLYYRTATFTLAAADSGASGSPIVYASYPGETARITGGARIPKSAFTPVTDTAILNRVISAGARSVLLQASLPAQGLTDYGTMSRHGFNVGATPPMELYVETQPMILARWPNPGSANVQMASIVNKGPTGAPGTVAPSTNRPTFTYSYTRPQYWTLATDIWLDGIFGYNWEYSFNQVAAIDTVAHTIALNYGENSGLLPLSQASFADFHFATNLLEEIDIPGEYYIDRGAGLLYLDPPASFSLSDPDITVTMLKTALISSNGANYVTFDNLVLECGRTAAASMANGQGLLFSRCAVRNFGNGGITLQSGASNGIVDCVFRHIGGTVAYMVAGNLTTLAPGNDFVENCDFADFGYFYKTYHPAIYFSGVGNSASNNVIHDAPHTGVLVYGNNHLFTLNEIYNVCTTFCDAGAIYFNLGSTPSQVGTVISYNYLHDIGPAYYTGVEGVYLDNQTMGVTVANNVFYNFGNDGVKINGGGNHVIINNTFIDTHAPCDNADYLLTPATQPWPATNQYQGNLMYNPVVPIDTTVGSPTLVNANGAHDKNNLLQYANNWVAASDPGFVDRAHHDFHLVAGAAAYSHIPGFAPIPFDQMGLQAIPGTAFTTDFESGGNGWLVDATHAIAADGTGNHWYEMTSGSASLSPASYSNYVLTFTVQSPATVPVGAILTIYDRNNGAVSGRITYAKTGAAASQWTLLNPAGGTVAQTILSVEDLPANSVNRFKLIVSGPDILLYVNGVLKVKGVDATHNPSGAVGFAVSGFSGAGFTNFLFDTVAVSQTADFTDFQSGGNGWEVDSLHSITAPDGSGNRMYQIANGANSQSPLQYGNYIFDCTVKMPASITPGSYLLFYDRIVSGVYGKIMYTMTAAGASKWEIKNGAWTTLASKILTSEDLPAGSTNQVTLVACGSSVSLYVNGALRLSANDATYNAFGNVGFYVSGFSQAQFDNLSFQVPIVKN